MQRNRTFLSINFYQQIFSQMTTTWLKDNSRIVGYLLNRH